MSFSEFLFDWLNDRDPDLVREAWEAYELTPEGMRLREHAEQHLSFLANSPGDQP